MKSPIPLLAIGAALLLLKSKGGSKAKNNLLVIKADSPMPILKGPYIQVTSTVEDVTSDQLADLVRPASNANRDTKFVVAGIEGIDRLNFSQHHADFTTPDEFVVIAIHEDAEAPVVQRVKMSDVTSFEEAFTALQKEVDAAVSYMNTPYTPGS